MTILATQWPLQRVPKTTLNKKETERHSPLLRWVSAKSLLEPEKLLRLGTFYGGWLIPVDSGLSSDSVCYTAGAGEDISFDCALAERFHCLVRIIDPTPRAIQHFLQLENAVRTGTAFPVNNSTSNHYSISSAAFERLHFLPVGLAGQDADFKFFYPRNPAHVSCSIANLQKTHDYFTAKCLRLSSIMEMQGDVSIDMLKMDIEGAEYGVLEDILGARSMPRLLLIEFDEAHCPLDATATERIKTQFVKLAKAGMRCIAVEGSNATFVRDE